MNSSGGTSTTTMNNIPSYAQDELQSYITRANSIAFNSEWDGYYSQYSATNALALTLTSYDGATGLKGTTYANLSTAEQAGITNLAARGRYPNTTITKAKTFIANILNGNYLLCTNAEFTTMLNDVTGKPNQSFADNIRPLLGATCYLIGDLSAKNQAQTLVDSIIPTRYNDRILAYIYNMVYRAERVYQSDALVYGAEYARTEVQDAEYLRNAGLYYRIWQQVGLEDNYKMWYEGQVLPINRKEVAGHSISVLTSTYKRTTEPYNRTSGMQGAAGGMLAMLPLAIGTGGVGAIAMIAAGGVLGGMSTQ